MGQPGRAAHPAENAARRGPCCAVQASGRRWRRARLGSMDEQPLAGGFVTAVVRIGDTVRRAQPPDPDFVHALLGLFERHGWRGAPRFLGIDEQGREMLSFLDGHVAWRPAQPSAVTSEASRRMRLICDVYGLRDQPLSSASHRLTSKEPAASTLTFTGHHPARAMCFPGLSGISAATASRGPDEDDRNPMSMT